MLRVIHGPDCRCGRCGQPDKPLELHIHVHLPDLSCIIAQTVVEQSDMTPTLRIASPPTRTLDPGDKPITDAYAAWVADMRRRHKADCSIKRMGTHIQACCNWVGWVGVRQMDGEGLTRWLGAMVSERKWSGATHDVALAALRAFGKFCHAQGWVDRQPFAGIAPSAMPAREAAGALTVEQARAMVRAGSRAFRSDRRARCNRGLFYGLLILSGLRYAEASRIRWRDLDLDADPPVLVTDPAWAKNRRELRIALAPPLVRELRAERDRVAGQPDERVFAMIPNRGTWASDRKAAGVPAVNGQRRKLSFHSCRKTLATWLYAMVLPDGSRVSEAVVKAIMRHDQGDAHARYAETLNAQVLAVGQLPDIFADWDGNGVDKPGRRTDTHGAKSESDPVPTPAVDPQSRLRKPLCGFPAGLEAGSVTGVEQPLESSTGPPSSERLCPLPSQETRDELIRVLEAGSTMMLAVARLLAKSEVSRDNQSD